MPAVSVVIPRPIAPREASPTEGVAAAVVAAVWGEVVEVVEAEATAGASWCAGRAARWATSQLSAGAMVKLPTWPMRRLWH